MQIYNLICNLAYGLKSWTHEQGGWNRTQVTTSATCNCKYKLLALYLLLWW